MCSYNIQLKKIHDAVDFFLFCAKLFIPKETCFVQKMIFVQKDEFDFKKILFVPNISFKNIFFVQKDAFCFQQILFVRKRYVLF